MTRTNIADGWSHRRKVSPFQELAGATAQDWVPVRLPHDAVIATPRRADAPGGETNGYFDGGAFQYRRTVAVPAADSGKPMWLEFDGVHRDAMVYVNDALAGQWAFGYSRFVVRIDPYLRFGTDNEIRVDCRTHLDSRWYAGAGIHRDAHLIVKEPVHLAVDGGVRVTTPDVDDERAVVEVATTVRNLGPLTVTPVLRAVVQGPDGADVATGRSPVTLLPGEDGVVRQRLVVERPARWSVDIPNLYSVRLELRDGAGDDAALLDTETVAVGIRVLQLDARRGLRVNGEPVKLRGACIHSDNGPLGAAAIGRAEERRVELLKAAGFNAIRSAHNPLSSALLDACDRLGMLVMDETFDSWTSSKTDFDYAFEFPQWWERDVEAMVTRARNHPSVVFYSIGNEIPETGNPHGANWGRKLAEKVRSLDPTRFVTNAINPFVASLDMVLPAMQQQRAAAAEAAAAGGVNTMMNDFGSAMNRIQVAPPVTARTEESFAVLDVAGMNYADARYELDRDLFPDRVIIGTETWPTSIAGNWALVTANPHVIGDFTWTGWDYLGEVGIGVPRYADQGAAGLSTGYPGLVAGCGDFDITGHRRPVSYFREIVFGLRDTPYIAVFRPENHGRPLSGPSLWAWTDTVASWSWTGHEGDPVTVEVYSDADEIELRLDGAVLERAEVGASQPFRALFETVYRPGTLTAVAYTAGEVSGECSLTSAADELVLHATADRTQLRADHTDLAFVDLTLADAAGVVHPGRDRPVRVEVAGPAVLAALGSANPVTTESFAGPEHTTHDGRALAVVRPTGPGKITVTATTDGAAAAVVTLHAG